MKDWLVKQIAGPLGFLVKPIIAALVAVPVALIYEQAWIIIYKVAWLKFFADRVVDYLAKNNPDVLGWLTPGTVATFAAGAVWLWLQNLLINRMKAGAKQIQNTLNASPSAPNVTVDGIITRGGETAASVTRLAYERLYPDDTANRGGDGMPETRKPLP